MWLGFKDQQILMAKGHNSPPPFLAHVNDSFSTSDNIGVDILISTHLHIYLNGACHYESHVISRGHVRTCMYVCTSVYVSRIGPQGSNWSTENRVKQHAEISHWAHACSHRDHWMFVNEDEDCIVFAQHSVYFQVYERNQPYIGRTVWSRNERPW